MDPTPTPHEDSATDLVSHLFQSCFHPPSFPVSSRPEPASSALAHRRQLSHKSAIFSRFFSPHRILFFVFFWGLRGFRRFDRILFRRKLILQLFGLGDGVHTISIMQAARVNLKGWQQVAVAFGSAFGALLDPRRADLIAALGETTGKPAFGRILQRMKNSAEGREVLLERPRVISMQVSHAWDMPQNTFGAAYAQFMGSRNFSPDDRPPVRFMDTDELAFVATRAREVHDFWHVLFGLPTNLIGETALKVIEFEQMFLPMCMLSVVGGSARFSEKQRTLFFQHYFPWATKAGLRSTDLMSVYYEKHFHEDLEEVRRNWGIVPCPDPKRSSV